SASYVHEIERMVVEGTWWAPGPSTPTAAMADTFEPRAKAPGSGAPLSAPGPIAVMNVNEKSPQVFGTAATQEEYDKARWAVSERARMTLEAVRAIPPEILLGLAVTFNQPPDSRDSLPERLVAFAAAHRDDDAMML